MIVAPLLLEDGEKRGHIGGDMNEGVGCHEGGRDGKSEFSDCTM